MKNTHDTTTAANKKKLNREIIRIGLVTGLVTLLIFAWMARGTNNTQAAEVGDSLRHSLARGTNYVAAKLGFASVAVAVAAGNVSGTVFQDYNGNGTFNTTATIPNDGNISTVAVAVDRGISAVTVNAYNDANTIIATATTCGTTVAGVCTGSNPGFYQLTVPVGTNLVRLEFVNLPAGFEASAQGTDSQSSVRFVDTTAGGVANVNFAVNVPQQYSPNNPLLATTCFVVGAQNSAANTNQTVILSFPYSSGANGTVSAEYGVPTTHGVDVKAPTAGTTWGLAYARKARRLYAASYFKKYAGFGPGANATFNSTVDGAGVYQTANSSDDAGAIYVINRDTNALAATFTVPGATTNPHKTDAYDRDNGDTGWDATGKFGLGGLDVSEDEARLYVMNLQNRTLYALNRSTGAVLASQAVPTTGLAAGPTGSTCAAGDVRPFAVKFHQGQLYVGMVCSAESTTTVDSGWTDTNTNGRYNTGEPFADGDGNGIYNTKDARYLRAYVFTVNPTTLAFGASPTFQAALNYPRGIPEPSNGGYRSQWLPWVNAFPTNMAGFWASPQPLLTDLEFDGAGNLMLAIRDRAGDQGGEAALDNPANNTTYAVRPSGDLLKACGSPAAGWTLESNGRCGGVGAAPQNTGQGPDNGEFFHNDDYSTTPNAGQFHDEVVLAGLTQMLGFPHVVTSTFDPIPRPLVDEAFTGGFRWLGLTTGTFNKAYRVYFNTGENFGKASGLGDVEPLHDLPPVEIGNRVWMDADANGIQDPSEMALAGVTVRLYNGATLVATAVTDTNGSYAFSNDPRGYAATGNNAPNNTASNGGFTEDNQGGRASTASQRYGIAGLTLGNSYQLRFDNATNYTAGNPLFGKLATLRDVTANAQDTRDSDIQLPAAAPIGPGNYPFIAVDLTAVTEGQNQHHFDAGFRVCAAITVSPATLPNGTVGVAYNQTVSASGDTAPYTFAVTTGALPAGLMLNGATGAITGTPTTAGSNTFTITATDANGCTRAVMLTIAITTSCPAITVNPTTLPNGTVGTAYPATTISATGGTGPYTFAVSVGALPAGLTLNATTGLISGTPTSGATANFTIRATDTTNSCTGTRAFTVTPACTTITITPASLPNGQVNVAYNQTLTASGGTTPYTWALTVGTLPAGMTFNTATGVLGGTPTAAGASALTFRATSAGGCIATINYNLRICAAITVNAATVNAMTVGTAFTQTFTGAGGTAPYMFAVTAGALPAGLTLNATSGVLSGTPTSNAAASFTITATDNNGCGGLRAYTITPTCPTLTLGPNTATVNTMVVGTAYSRQLTVTGGTAPFTWTLNTGTLPAGITLSSGGLLSGTPTSTTTVSFSVRVTDTYGCTNTRNYNNITPTCPTISVTPLLPTPGLPTPITVGTAYSASFGVTGGATGGTAPFTFSVSAGTLPLGLTLDPATGALTGTPTSSAAANFTIRAQDFYGCAGTRAYALTPACPTITVNPATLPAMNQGVAFSQTISVTTTLTGAVTYAVTAGALPTGLTLTPAGLLSGTPSGSGAYSFTITATHTASGCLGSRAYSGTICATLTITPNTLPNAVLGTAYNQSLAVSGGTGPYTFSLLSGSLPAGLTLSSGGAITGIPTALATGNFTVGVVDASGCAGNLALSIAVNCQTITINQSNLPNGVIGTPYSQTLTATGGTGALTWTLDSGTLPVGLSLSTGGVISGTPTANGSPSFVVRVTDVNGCFTTQALSIVINCPTITVTPASLPSATVGQPYSQQMSQAGGTGTITWSVSVGTLPTGLTLNASTGLLSGTPTTAGSTNVTIRATDANGCGGQVSLTIVRTCPAITFTTTSLPNAVVGTPYNATVSATGGTTPYSYAVTLGSLPAGLTMTTAGAISGTPTAAGAFTFTITATDAADCTGSRTFTVRTCDVISVTPSSLPNATINQPYSQTLGATGGTGPYTFTLTGALPAGLTLTNGVISGTPTALGAATFTINVNDSTSCPGSRSLTITVVCNNLNITTSSLPNPVAGVAYNQSLAATGGVNPLTWTLATGSLPTGLTLSTAGVISGTTTDVTAHTFTVRVTDANGCFGSRSFTLTAGCSTMTFVTPTSLPQGTVGAVYPSTTFTVTGGATPYTFSLGSIMTGTLPTGMTFTNGVLAGTPTVPFSGTITFKVTDNGGCMATIDLSLVINCQNITLDQTAVGPFVVGTPYSQQLTATGGRGTVTWSLVTPGTLPLGLPLTSSGLLAGTPTSNASATFTIRVTDVNGCRGERAYTSMPNCPTVTVTGTLPNGTVGTPYSQTLGASGGVSPYTFSVIGTLPAGLSLTGNSIGGTPTSTAATTFSIRATDANGCFGATQFTITPACNTLTITTNLPNGQIGAAYSQQLTAQGATGATTWNVVSPGVLPAGLTLTPSGLLSGTPTSTVARTFTVRVIDANNCPATASFSITPICNTNLTIAPTTLPVASINVAYNQTLSLNGATGAVNWTITTGSLPTGLSLGATTGVISGTPTATATAAFTVRGTDVNGCMATREYSLMPQCNTFTFNPIALPTATVGTAYNVTFTASGANGTVTWSVASTPGGGTLPAGLTLSAAGLLSGTPTSTAARTFTIKGTDANGCMGTREFTLTPVCNILTINPTTLPQGQVGAAYNATLTSPNALAPLTWTVSDGALPAGITLNATTGVLSGTPTSTVDRSFTIRLTDANGCTTTRPFTVRPVCNVLTVNPATLPNGFVGVAYNQTLTVEGATGTVTWSVAAGTLPNGIALNATTGVLSGVPTTAGSSTVTLKATDANGCMGTREFTIVIAQVFSIGNRVFKDLNDDGLLNNGDTGINGVIVRLLTSGGAIAKNAAGVDVAPITTAGGGYYRFDGMAAGDYMVEVAASNFTGTGALVGCTSSTRDAADPDTDVDDNDDNGVGTAFNATNGIRSAVLTLGPNAGSEPVNEIDRGPNDPAEPNNNTNLTIDFGFTTTMSLGNLVWKDLNNNGRFDTGEPGVDGVKLDLYLDRDSSGGFSSADSPAVANTVTANGGFYSFTGLTPGKYVVNVINTNFRTGGALLGCFSSTVTASNPDNDVDNDDNGADDNDPSNNGSASRVITLVGFGEPTTDGDGNNGNATVDFGFYAPVSLGNAVWKDANNNGRKDSGEPGIDGVVVELLKDADNSGALNGSELTTIIQTRGTLNGGTYQFTNLPPGNYVVRLAASNFVGAGALVGCVSSTVTNANPNDNTDNDDNGIDVANPATTGILSGVITLTSFGEPPATVDSDDNNSNGTVDFGFYTPVNLGNLIYKDLNNNGFREGGEPGINGVRVELFRDANNNNQLDANDGGAIANTTTINGGLYSFPNLAPGNYFVRIAASNFSGSGALVDCVSSTTTNANANSNIDNDDNGIDTADPATSAITSGVITLQGGTEPPANVDGDDANGNQTVDFGFVSANQSIGNLVWKDANRNGRRDNGETGVSGVKLNLYRDNGDRVFNAATDVLVKMTTSNSTGSYQFTGLITATYFVQIDASNFGNEGATAGALNGCISTNGTNDPNTDTDDDDNGSDSYNPATQPPTSGPVILTTNGEPTNDGDGANGNNTIDFGFINFLNINIEDPATCVGPGVVLQLTARLTNPSNVTQRDNAGNEFEAQLPAEVVVVPNSCVASSGACSFDGNRRVVWNGALAPNSTLTIRYKIQLANNVQAGVPYCITSVANFDADNNGSNETSASVTVCDVANCPQVGPGTPNEGCSVLIFPVYTSNAANPVRGNTRISITNTSVNQPATMHLFFVDGESCSIADSYLCLTPNQTTSFTMSDLDPGTTGYMIAVAVDPTTGCPTYFNHLIGDSYVKFDSGHYANLKAQCAKALPGGNFSCNPNEQMATLNFDDEQYSRLPRVLAIDNLPSPADGNDTRLYLTRIGGDMAVGADSLGALFGLVYDDAEKAYSFGATVPNCQLRTPLNGTYPRTSPRIDSIIPAGRSGWMKVWTQGGGAMVGAAITRNSNTVSQPGAFDGGHDLHVLRYAESARISIPIFPGHCQ